MRSVESIWIAHLRGSLGLGLCVSLGVIALCSGGAWAFTSSATDAGLYVHYCPHQSGVRPNLARAANTSEAGWPPDQCLKMDKGPAGRSHTLVGMHGVHNWLLGGYGNDTIVGGDIGDVIWADYHPSGEPPSQTATIQAGNGANVIYANDTHDYVWTGSDARTVVHAHNPGTSGVIHCQSAGIVVFLSTISQRHFKLDGCRHISHFSVGY
jgi:RTX calcium-binding nonapeptide repeat (4 copies)